MTKKRKVCSPQTGESEICADLKAFIVQENAKCVKEIKESNERRLVAIEESLSFALDSITAVSERQQSADVDILDLQREVTDLRQRLRQLENSEDRRQQDGRLTSLIFSGAALQALPRREEAAELIRSVVQQYLRHTLDRSQVRTVFRMRNGKILMDFTTAARDSDRDVLFRNKSKLRGSGLFVSESLTPRRQAMFADLLQLRKTGHIFSVFTQSGNIFVCRSSDTAPIRLADPEAVMQLAGGRADRGPAQGRAQAGSRGGPPVSARERERRGRLSERAAEEPAGMEVEMGGPADSASPADRGTRVLASGVRPVDSGAGSAAVAPTPTVSQRRPGSSLLDCAEEDVNLVQLSPPLDAVSTASPGAVSGGSPALPSGGLCGRPAGPGPVTGGAASGVHRSGSGESRVGSGHLSSDGRDCDRPAAPGSVLSSGGGRGKPSGPQPARGGAEEQTDLPSLSTSGRGRDEWLSEDRGRGELSGERSRSLSGMRRGVNHVSAGTPRQRPWDMGKGGGSSGYRDIREYF